MLKVEIFKENEKVNVDKIPANEKRGELTFYSQIAYVYLGGKFPVEMKISIDENETHYAAGMYEVDLSSFVVSERGNLEFKKYGLKIVPANQVKAA